AGSRLSSDDSITCNTRGLILVRRESCWSDISRRSRACRNSWPTSTAHLSGWGRSPVPVWLTQTICQRGPPQLSGTGASEDARSPQRAMDVGAPRGDDPRHGVDVGGRRVKVHDARTQRVASTDDGVRDEDLAVALERLEQGGIQRVEVLAGRVRLQIARHVP